MKVLYAIQGTGNGHLSRARDIIPILQKKDIELDVLVSGTQADVAIPHPIKYQLKGLSFIFGKKGGVNMWKTYLKSNSLRLQKEIQSLPIVTYDLVINDFEPVSAWACKRKDVPCVSLSHQVAVLNPGAPKPKKSDPFGQFILKNYAPTKKQFGLHFQNYDKTVFTPIIRKDIREAVISEGNHYTVYLPSYSDEKIISILSQIPEASWEIFSKQNRTLVFSDHIKVFPITNEAFVKSMATSKGVLCGAGFETPAEALFMNKKLMVVPMKGQYEQQCNAAALKTMGVSVIKSLKTKHLDKIVRWVNSDKKVKVSYPDITEQLVDQVLKEAIR